MFRTELDTPPADFHIGLHDPVFTIGSCFSDNIGELLTNYKFKTQSNPFGTVYNPVSIQTLVRYAINNEEPEATTYLENDGLHANHNFHSSFSGLDEKQVKQTIKKSIGSGHTFLKTAKVVIITLGTAFVYVRQSNGEIVSNCHKLPAKEFDKKLLSVTEIKDALDHVIAQLTVFNPEMRVILTVSPVRHIKDTLDLNSVSKSLLRVACHTAVEAHESVDYFPSYELVLDDLRDYRFYESDLIHPNQQAIDYIWTKFRARYFDTSTNEFIDKWAKIRQALQHRPFNPASEKHQSFLRQTLKKIEALDQTIGLTEEIAYLKSQLSLKG